jgi:hypothetical protein
VIDAGSFVFDQPQFAAVVHPTTGSVVAAALITSSSGLELVPASRSLTLAVAAGEPGFAGRLGVVAVGDDAATADAAGITVNARSALAGFPTGLDPDGPASVALPNVFPFAVTLDERAGSPLAAAMVWGLRIRGGGDIGAVPAVAPANEWTIVAGPPATPDRLHLVIANPSDSPVVVRCRLFTPNAAIDPPGLAALTILPGRAVSIVLSQAAVVPVGVELTSTGPAIAAAIVGVSGNGPATAVYGLAGVAEASPRPVDVEVDPRAGADAR